MNNEPVTDAEAQCWMKKLGKRPITMYAAAKKVGESKRTVLFDTSYRFNEWVWKELGVGRLELDSRRRLVKK